MTTTSLAARPTLHLFPLYRSELSRVTHRRLFRVLALVLLGGIIVVSAIAFVVSRNTAGATVEELQKNKAQEQMYFDDCAQKAPLSQVQDMCGPNPADRPLEEFDYGTDRRYKAQDNLPAVVLATSFAVAGLAFIIGASTGGAEWSSRSMTLQLLWEPRRLRLLATKWVALISAVVALGVVALVLALGLGGITASIRGTWQGRLDSELGDNLKTVLITMGWHGLVIVAIAATAGFAIAILVRNTGASLGVAFVYFAVGETAIRLALYKFGPEPFMLSTNTVAFMIPAGLDVPGREQLAQGGGTEPVMVHLSNLRSLVTLLVYSIILIVPASWSFARRDIG